MIHHPLNRETRTSNQFGSDILGRCLELLLIGTFTHLRGSVPLVSGRRKFSRKNENFVITVLKKNHCFFVVIY